MFLEVVKAEYIDGYCLKVWFNNGDIMVVDLKDSLTGEIFNPLKHIEYFKKFTIKFNTLEWPNDADFAPEYLHSIGMEVPA